MLTIKAESQPGEDITETISAMCVLASRLGCMVQVTFNDVRLVAKPGADPRDMLRQWDALQADRTPRYRGVCGHTVELPDWTERHAQEKESEHANR